MEDGGGGGGDSGYAALRSLTRDERVSQSGRRRERPSEPVVPSERASEGRRRRAGGREGGGRRGGGGGYSVWRRLCAHVKEDRLMAVRDVAVVGSLGPVSHDSRFLIPPPVSFSTESIRFILFLSN